MIQQNIKSSIEKALKDFSQGSTGENIKRLFEVLGYSTQREIILNTHTTDEVVEVFGWESFQEDRGLLKEWESVDCLFQVTEDEITQNSQLGLFKPCFAKDYLQSYAFLGLTLKNNSYSRSQLASITREINRQSDIPIMVLFYYGESVTLSIINRRPNKLDRDKDVLEKITLIKDINLNFPHRAHIEILNDLALVSLKNVHNFDELHTAWQKVLDTSELNKKFFQEVSNWYFWAISKCSCSTGFQPVNHDNKQDACGTEVFVIRLITRLIFVWFLKEKGLVSNTLFDENEIKGLLKSLESDESTYYKAILQNLFFATLNTEMNTAKKPDNRKFRGKTTQKGGRDQHYGVANVYRYEDYFVNSDEFLELCSNIPFLNGGLFECLDKPSEKIRIDGFSDRKDNPLTIPNVLFFGEEMVIDLNNIYGTKNKKYKVQGLIEIFNRYKFTIDENTPIEEEIALDPELLGKVFENLLAEYNPETETTARKQTGSFYTPREIVNYMVDESLIAYLVEQASSLYNPTNKQDACATATDIFFSEDTDIDIKQRNLPHWRQEGVTYFVTFHLADSISQDKLNLLKQEREEWLKKHKKPLSKAQTEEYYRLFSQQVENWLDAGMGECYLKDAKIVQIVADALGYFNGDRYRLGEWVIMPNHVHVLVTPLGENKLSDILHSWKSFTANQINKALNRRGKVWQEEYYDRIIRSPQHLYLVEQYIHNNPQKAGISIVAQASSLYNPTNKQDACATVDTQDGCGTLKDKLRHLLAYNNEPHQFNDKEVDRLINAIDNVKIIDIACGSGAFPMGILQKLVFILGKLDPNNSKWKQQQKEKAIQPVLKDIQTAKQISYEDAREEAIEKLQERLAEIEREFEDNEMDYPRKLFLIENCIFGVDIQPIAVQIAKLRFFVSLIVDQKVNDNQPNRGILPLPNLETKFVAANSLIGIETQLTLRSPEVIKKEEELKKVRQQHFTARTPKTKKKCREKDEALRQEISELLKSTGLETAIADTLARWNPYNLNASSDFFDAEWMFGVTDGFDICIGNPPYVRIQNIDPQKAIILKEKFVSATGKFDIYVLFVEKSFQLINKNGGIYYIHPHRFLTADYGKGLKKFIDLQKGLKLAICFGVEQIFNTATTYTGIFGYSFNNNSFNYKIATSQDFKKTNFTQKSYHTKGEHWMLSTDDNISIKIINKLKSYSYTLQKILLGINQGIVTVGDDIFILKGTIKNEYFYGFSDAVNDFITIESQIVKPILKGEHIRRYESPSSDLFVFYPHFLDNKGKTKPFSETILLSDFPCAYQYISEFKKMLIDKKIKYKTNPNYWYSLHRSRDISIFHNNKILTPQLQNHPNFTLDTDFWFTDAGGYCLVRKVDCHLDYLPLLAILNSSVLWFFIVNTSNAYNNNYYYFKTKYLEPFSVPIVSQDKQKILTKLVHKILEIKRENPKADTRELEREIDEIVYQLYGLNEEEIAIIEGVSSRNEINLLCSNKE